MKIAAFYSDSPFAGWVQCQGFSSVLKRMGHEVVSIAVPPRNSVTQADADRINKPIDDCDLVLVSGPEWLKPWIQRFYPQWNSLKMPKVGWYHESFVRDDFTLDYSKYESMFDCHFFPDKDDAEKYKGEWLPLGVDTCVFQPYLLERDIEVGFIGLMYPKRAEFVKQLEPHLGDIKIRYMNACQSEKGLIPAISVFDADGINLRRSMDLLAETYSRIKVFVTFPSMSRVVVAKVLESLACGCTLVAPEQPVSLPYYSYSGAYQCAERIREALKQPRDGVDYMRTVHNMELRFAEIFSKVGLCVTS